jgi:phenylalanyl-tRNA synthetase beta subunit
MCVIFPLATHVLPVNFLCSMLISRTWLQTFFETSLPATQVLVDTLIQGVFEVEGVEKKGSDEVMDVKILTNRGDCFSHLGIAREISLLLGIPLKLDPFLQQDLPETQGQWRIEREDVARAPVYTAAVLVGVRILPSPVWLKDMLEAIGERSINNVVDATNYVMHHLGQPLHVFDAQKIPSKKIVVRPAYEKEHITLLGGKVLELKGFETLIADGEGRPLALAGVKGGTCAEVTNDTVDIVIESACFPAVLTRRASRGHGVLTGASKRYEHGIPLQLPTIGLAEALQLIQKLAGGTLAEVLTTPPPRIFTYTTGVSVEQVNSVLGSAFTKEQMYSVLKKLTNTVNVVQPTNEAVRVAHGLIGVPYKFGSSITREAPDFFDCSALTAYCYARAGVSIPRMSVDQYVFGTPVEKENMQIGDLIFSNSDVGGHMLTVSKDWAAGTPVTEGISHVGMYVGEGNVLHTASGTGSVSVQRLSDAEAFKTVVGYRRVTTDTERYVLEVPWYRPDLRLPEDIVEEVGRVLGLHTIKSTPLPTRSISSERAHDFARMTAVRAAFGTLGMLEIYSHSIVEEGYIALTNALSKGRERMRERIVPVLQNSVTANEAYRTLTGVQSFLSYEVGKVFTVEGEYLHVAVAAPSTLGKADSKIATAQLVEARSALAHIFGELYKQYEIESTPTAFEVRLSDLVPLSTAAQPALPRNLTYTPFSTYPFIARDIAAWIPSEVLEEDVVEVVRAHAGPLLVRVEQFDQFTKDMRTSRGMRLVFQSYEKTLTDEEVFRYMQQVTSAYTELGWEVR